MRAIRHALAAVSLAGLLVPALASAQQITPAQLLQFRPVQKELPVEYDTPTGDEIAACKAEMKPDPQTKGFAYILRDAQGRLLRRFADTNGKKGKDGKPHLDLWSFYKDGFEVYREVDLDKDGFADECHWLNTGGSRAGLLKDNQIVGWKRLSAEEASRVLVQALVSGKPALLNTVLATPDEMTSLGIPPAAIDRLVKERANLAAALDAIKKGLIGWDAQTVWQRFDGTMPHRIPADAGLKDDLLLYENAFVFVGPATGESNPTKIAYLQVPDVVRVGETWKLTSLPKAVNPAEPVTTTTDGGLRAALTQSGGTAGPANDPQLDAALKVLAEHDKKSPGPDASKQDIATFHFNRVKLLDPVLKAASTDEDRLNYTRQVIDSLSAAYQTGLYAAAAKVLDKYVEVGGPIGSYAAYHKIVAEYTLDSEDVGGDVIQAQKTFLSKLEDFLGKHEQSEQMSDVLFQLASINEFNAEEEKARTFYARLAKDYKDTAPGKKAAGALKRLELVGKPIDLSGPGLDGKSLSTDAFKGKTLLVTFWNSTAEPIRKDLPELIRVYQKFKGKGFEILGVNLDLDKASLDAFLKENPLPWPQIFEPGGMDNNRLADEYGIISLPTMILVGGDGKVISRNVRNASDLERYLDKITSASTAARGPDLGSK